MKIKFNENIYELAQQPYVYGTRFSAMIKKGEISYDQIVEDTSSPDQITIYDDNDEVSGIYTGFKNRIAITIMEHVQIELENSDIQAQIEQLQSTIAALKTQQESQGEGLSKVQSDVSDMVATQTASLEDMGEAISSVADEQATTAQAIEDLGTEISELAASIEGANDSTIEAKE